MFLSCPFSECNVSSITSSEHNSSARIGELRQVAECPGSEGNITTMYDYKNMRHTALNILGDSK